MSDDTTTDRPEFVPIFAFAPTETYVHKVTVETPNQAGGWDKSTFDAEFLRVESDEYQDLIKKKPADVLDQVLVGWKNLRAADRRSFVEFTPEHKAAFLRIPQAVLSTFETFQRTQWKGREKN